MTHPFWQTTDYKAAYESQQREILELKSKVRDAERLADEAAVLVDRKVIGSRSPAADALLDYREPPQSERSDRIVELEREVDRLKALYEKTMASLRAADAIRAKKNEELQTLSEEVGCLTTRLAMATEFLIDNPHGVDVYVKRHPDGWMVERQFAFFHGTHWSNVLPTTTYGSVDEAIAAYHAWLASVTEDEVIEGLPTLIGNYVDIAEVRRYIEANGFEWQQDETATFNITTALGLMGGEIDALKARLVEVMAHVNGEALGSNALQTSYLGLKQILHQLAVQVLIDGASDDPFENAAKLQAAYMNVLSFETDITSAQLLSKMAQIEEKLNTTQANLEQIDADSKHALDAVYAERNKLVALLSSLYPSSLEHHIDRPEEAPWDDDWRWVVFVDLPTGQASWHIHVSELPYFSHLPRNEGRLWDNHSTNEKYDRVLAARGQ